VLEGEVRFRLGDEDVDVGPRSFVNGPRGVAHGFTMHSDTGRVMLFFGPAGVEEFFREASAYVATVPPGEPPEFPPANRRTRRPWARSPPVTGNRT
jgi:hypothetical protein